MQASFLCFSFSLFFLAAVLTEADGDFFPALPDRPENSAPSDFHHRSGALCHGCGRTVKRMCRDPFPRPRKMHCLRNRHEELSAGYDPHSCLAPSRILWFRGLPFITRRVSRRVAAGIDQADCVSLGWKSNSLVAVTGRVCSHFCETRCSRNSVDSAIISKASNALRQQVLEAMTEPRRKKHVAPVAVVGFGPAGLLL